MPTPHPPPGREGVLDMEAITTQGEGQGRHLGNRYDANTHAWVAQGWTYPNHTPRIVAPYNTRVHAGPSPPATKAPGIHPPTTPCKNKGTDPDAPKPRSWWSAKPRDPPGPRPRVSQGRTKDRSSKRSKRPRAQTEMQNGTPGKTEGPGSNPNAQNEGFRSTKGRKLLFDRPSPPGSNTRRCPSVPGPWWNASC